MKIEKVMMEQFKGMSVEQILEYASNQAREATTLLKNLERKEENGKTLQRSPRSVIGN